MHLPIALALLSTACQPTSAPGADPDSGDDPDPSALRPLERVNGVDDDGDGEIDEPVNMAQADLRWSGVYAVKRDVAEWADPTPDLVPVETYALQLVPREELLRDRGAEDVYVAWVDWEGYAWTFNYTADLDGDGLAEFSTTGDVSYDGDGTQAWSGADLAAETPLGEPDYVCDTGPYYPETYFAAMIDVGPLADGGTHVACGFDNINGFQVPLYGPEAFADGVASPEEADTTVYVSRDASMVNTRADLDGDGVPDLLFEGDDSGILLFSGAGLTPGEWWMLHADHRWTGVPWGFSAVGGDVTGDGLPDLLVSERYGEVWKATGDRTWLLDPTAPDGELSSRAVSTFQIDLSGPSGDAITVGDGDGDGHDEVAIGRYQIGDWLDYGSVWLLPGAVLTEPGTHGPPDAAMTIVSDIGGIHEDLLGYMLSARDLLDDGRLSLVLSGDDGVAGVFYDIAWR